MRSRSHILEEESLFELKRILPNDWVIREKPKDYGLDVEIEIFTKEGDYTGLVFWIQLKATDESNVKKQRSIRLPLIKIRQLASYNLPVAIFRYNSVNREFYYDWIIRFGYLSSSSKNKTFNIEFEDHNLWSINSFKDIITFLKSRERYLKNNFSFPIKAFLNNINGPSNTSRNLSSKILKNSSLITLVRNRSLSDLEINLLENRIVLNLSGAYGSSIGYEKSDLVNSELIYNAFNLAMLLLLNHSNKDQVLFDFIAKNELISDIIQHQGMLMYLLPKLLTSETGIHFTSQIVDHIFNTNDPISQSVVQVIILLSSENIVSQERVESYFKQVIDLDKQNKNNHALSTTYYNYGNYKRGIRNIDEAFINYHLALKLDETYLSREYFCRELAGILFELQRFNLSAKFYRRSIKIDPSNIFSIATLGDAEMFSGNYKLAVELFDEFLTKNGVESNDNYEFSLKYSILKNVIEIFDIKSQKRNVIGSYKALEALTVDELKNPEVLMRLIQMDMLNPFVWSKMSYLYEEAQDLNMLFLSTLIQAVIIKFDPLIWATLILLTTYKDGPIELLSDIANSAYFYCREEFFSALQSVLELDDFEDFKGDEFMDYIESIVKDPEEPQKEIRFWDDDGVKIIKL